jgi:hypothetical protein
MPGPSFANTSRHVALDGAALRWSAQQAMTDWALRKSGGGLVPVEYQQAKWWTDHLRSARLLNDH